MVEEEGNKKKENKVSLLEKEESVETIQKNLVITEDEVKKNKALTITVSLISN